MPIAKRIESMFDSAPIRKRVYRCVSCGTQQIMMTNHQHDCWPICIGTCRGLLTDGSYRHTYQTQTTHEYVRDYNGKLRNHERCDD